MEDIDDKIAINYRNEIVLISKSNVLYIMSNRAFVNIYLVDGTEFKTKAKMKEILNALSSSVFKRIHHSFIVNMTYAKSVDMTEEALLELEGGIKLPISRRKKTEITGTMTRL